MLSMHSAIEPHLLYQIIDHNNIYITLIWIKRLFSSYYFILYILLQCMVTSSKCHGPNTMDSLKQATKVPKPIDPLQNHMLSQKGGDSTHTKALIKLCDILKMLQCMVYFALY